LGLLEHHLADQHPVGVGPDPPGIPCSPLPKPHRQRCSSARGGFRSSRAREDARVRFEGTTGGTMATVRDVMSSQLISVEPQTTVAEAATIMGGKHVGSALVMD